MKKILALFAVFVFVVSISLIMTAQKSVGTGLNAAITTGMNYIDNAANGNNGDLVTTAAATQANTFTAMAQNDMTDGTKTLNGRTEALDTGQKSNSLNINAFDLKADNLTIAAEITFDTGQQANLNSFNNASVTSDITTVDEATVVVQTFKSMNNATGGAITITMNDVTNNFIPANTFNDTNVATMVGSNEAVTQMIVSENDENSVIIMNKTLAANNLSQLI